MHDFLLTEGLCVEMFGEFTCRVERLRISLFQFFELGPRSLVNTAAAFEIDSEDDEFGDGDVLQIQPLLIPDGFPQGVN